MTSRYACHRRSASRVPRSGCPSRSMSPRSTTPSSRPCASSRARSACPGSGPGKVPRQVLEARLGGSAQPPQRGPARGAARVLRTGGRRDRARPHRRRPNIDITAGEESGARRVRRAGPGAPDRGHPRLRRPPGRPSRPWRCPTRTSTPRSTGSGRTTASWSRCTRKARDKDNVTINLHAKSMAGRGGGRGRRLPLRGRDRQRRPPELDDQLRGAKTGRRAGLQRPDGRPRRRGAGLLACS